MIRWLLMMIIMTILLTACSSTDPINVVSDQTHLQHPEVLRAPVDPGISIKAITVERITSGELEDRAYIGFTYPDWLEFAKWMHEYKAHNESLKNAIQSYKEQDSRNSQLSTD